MIQDVITGHCSVRAWSIRTLSGSDNDNDINKTTNTSISDIGSEYTWDSKQDFGNNTTLYTDYENMGFSGIRSLMGKIYIFNTNTYI